MVKANAKAYNTEMATHARIRRLVLSAGKIRRKKNKNAILVRPWQKKYEIWEP